MVQSKERKKERKKEVRLNVQIVCCFGILTYQLSRKKIGL